MKAVALLAFVLCASCASVPQKPAPQTVEQLAERMKRIDQYCQRTGCKIMTTPEHEEMQKALEELLDRVRELEKPNLPAGMKCV